MKVANKTKGLILSGDAMLAESFRGRLKGLMFSKKKKDLVIKAGREGVMESSIHMMFMHYAIDLVWVNGSMIVVGVEKNVKPHDFRKPGTWKIHKSRKPALYVIELGCGSAGKTSAGDRIEFT